MVINHNCSCKLKVFGVYATSAVTSVLDFSHFKDCNKIPQFKILRENELTSVKDYDFINFSALTLQFHCH